MQFLSRPFARMPIIVIMHETRELESKSVGEKASSFPWLSVGASVMIVVPDFICVDCVLSGFEYSIL